LAASLFGTARKLTDFGPEAVETILRLIDLWERKSDYLSDRTNPMAISPRAAVAKSPKQIVPEVTARDGIS